MSWNIYLEDRVGGCGCTGFRTFNPLIKSINIHGASAMLGTVLGAGNTAETERQNTALRSKSSRMLPPSPQQLTRSTVSLFRWGHPSPGRLNGPPKLTLPLKACLETDHSSSGPRALPLSPDSRQTPWACPPHKCSRCLGCGVGIWSTTQAQLNVLETAILGIPQGCRGGR